MRSEETDTKGKIKILFICHSNICRSPMAEFIMKDLADKAGVSDHYIIDSKATSTEELYSAPHPKSQAQMRKAGLDFSGHRAIQMTLDDCRFYDYLIVMDEQNRRNVLRITGKKYADKIHMMREHSAPPAVVDDPWYTQDYDRAFREIEEGCRDWLKYFQSGE